MSWQVAVRTVDTVTRCITADDDDIMTSHDSKSRVCDKSGKRPSSSENSETQHPLAHNDVTLTVCVLLRGGSRALLAVSNSNPAVVRSSTYLE